MNASKFSEAQIAFVLKQAEEGKAVGEVCRKAGFSEATFYNWRKRYAGLMPSEVKRLRQPEEENAKLKRLVANLSLDKALLQDVLSKKALKPARRRQLVDEARETWQVSIRKACHALRIDRPLYTHKSRRGEQAPLKQRIKEICETRVRYGFRRMHVHEAARSDNRRYAFALCATNGPAVLLPGRRCSANTRTGLPGSRLSEDD